jgi:hypothetical protein
LDYNDAAKVMWCKVCTNHAQENKWNINKEYLDKKSGKKMRGIKRFKVDGIRSHALSTQHEIALNMSVQSKNLISLFETMYDKAHHEIKKLLSIALFVATENLAIVMHFSEIIEFEINR